MQQNLTTNGRQRYFPFEGSHATDFITLKNLPPSAVFEQAKPISDGKHKNH
jgi:hypothetical protein